MSTASITTTSVSERRRAVPERVGDWVQLADLQRSIGAMDAAIATYQRGIRVASEGPDARTGGVGRCLRVEIERARGDADVALEHGGDWPGCYERIGNTIAAYLAGAIRISSRTWRWPMRFAGTRLERPNCWRPFSKSIRTT